MQLKLQLTICCGLLILIVVFFSGQVGAATQVLDRIELSIEKEDNVISVYFNIPVRYVSHLVNEAGNEVGVQLKLGQATDIELGQTTDIELEDLVESDRLTWSPTAAVPLVKVEFQGNIIGTSTLLVSFAKPVHEVRIRQGRDFYVMQFILPESPRISDTAASLTASDIPVPETRAPLSAKSLPLVIYVINLSVQPEAVDFSKIPPVPVGENQLLYSTKTDEGEEKQYQLRLGFFRTKLEAEEQLKRVIKLYPDARIDTADIEERRQAFFERGIEHVFSDQLMEEPQLVDADPRLIEMMEMIRRTITAGEYAKAVRLLEALLEEPENIYSKEALELLGLSRERNGQIAHAKGEYRRYLEKYPEGEDAERVWQRLLGLETAPMQPKQPQRKDKEEDEDGSEVAWDIYGSFSQNYRREGTDSSSVEDGDSVTRSDVETFIDFNARRKSEDIDMRFKVTGSYILDLLDDGDGNDTSLSDAYFDIEHRDSHSNARFGRQRLRSSGILSRFDGLVLNYQLTPDVTLRASAGLPVERSRDTFLNEHKQFAGISTDIASIVENWDLSLFLVEQRVDDLVDRRAIGGEVRYFDPNKSLFSLLDYDIFHQQLGIFTLQGNWRFEDETRIYMNLDYRNSPILRTSNALTSQTDPDTSLAIESIEELQNFYSDDEIYELARDRTAKTTSLSFGINRPFSKTLQLSGDITMSKTGETPASGGVEATEETDNEFFYTFQVIKNDLLKQGDIGIFSLRYSDANASDTFRVGISSRYPITNSWRINPRFNLSYRKNDDNDDSRKTISPFIRMDYRYRKDMTFELEGGLNWFEEDDGTDVTNSTDHFIYGGYRWDF